MLALISGNAGTRATTGSRSALRASHLLGSFVRLVEERGWCLALPPHAHLVSLVDGPFADDAAGELVLVLELARGRELFDCIVDAPGGRLPAAFFR